MSKYLTGHLLAFRNLANGDEICSAPTLVEMTDVQTDGSVEIAFDMPAAPGKPRVYLKLPLAYLVQAAICAQPSKADE